MEPACRGPRRPHIGRGRTTSCAGVEEKGTPRGGHVRREVGKQDGIGEPASRKVQERRPHRGCCLEKPSSQGGWTVPRTEESRSGEGNEDGEIGPSGGIEPWRSSRARERRWGRRLHWGVVGRTHRAED